MKFIEEGRVLSNTELSSGVFDMRIFAPKISEAAAPGQFVMVYTGVEKQMLPRPISVCDVNKKSGELRIVYRVVGHGTEAISKIKKDFSIRLIGALGNGFPLDLEYKNPVVIGGGIGIPPMLYLSKALRNAPLAFLGDKEEPVLSKEFSTVCKNAYLASDSGKVGFLGNAVSLAEKEILEGGLLCDVIFACGPKPMLKAAADLADKIGAKAYLSLEERMACGLGACVGCAVKIKRDGEVKTLKVCKDGPVFSAKEVYYE